MNQDQKDCWHVISETYLLELLRRAHSGEEPNMLYMEAYVNATHEDVDDS